MWGLFLYSLRLDVWGFFGQSEVEIYKTVFGQSGTKCGTDFRELGIEILGLLWSVSRLILD